MGEVSIFQQIYFLLYRLLPFFFYTCIKGMKFECLLYCLIVGLSCFVSLLSGIFVLLPVLYLFTMIVLTFYENSRREHFTSTSRCGPH